MYILNKTNKQKQGGVKLQQFTWINRKTFFSVVPDENKLFQRQLGK